MLVIAVPVARTMGLAQLELHRARAEAERLSRTDPMTGLANRRAFYEAAAGLEGGALALVIVDIDRFKRINDRYGHAVGDEVIKCVATRMQEELGDLGVGGPARRRGIRLGRRWCSRPRSCGAADQVPPAVWPTIRRVIKPDSVDRRSRSASRPAAN